MCWRTLNSKILASLKQNTFSPPAWVSYWIVKFSRDPLWRLACAYCLRCVNKLWLFFSPFSKYQLCQKGLHEAETTNIISKAWNCQSIPEKVSLTVLKLWKYLCLPKMAFLRVVMWLCWCEFTAFCLTRVDSLPIKIHIGHEGPETWRIKHERYRAM